MEGTVPVLGSKGQVLGRIWKANGTWFADPKGSQVLLIPCSSETDAEETVRRLGEGR